jgi:hypothetical protein
MKSLLKVKSLVKWIFLVQLFPIIVYAQALPSIPTTSGWGGSALTGPAYISIQTNLIASGPITLGRPSGYKNIESIFSAPVRKSYLAALFPLDINYTFAKSKTQLFLGNRVEDIIRMDLPFNLGVRQELKDSSILAFQVIMTPNVSVWKDPYAENVDRESTDIILPGVRLTWGRIFKTGLELAASYRFLNLDAERSGEALIQQNRLNPDLQHLLNRGGKLLRLQALYALRINRHRFEPVIQYNSEFLDGAAMATKGYVFRVNYLYPTRKVIFDVLLNFGSRKAQAVNPIYNERFDAVRYGAVFAAFAPIKLGKSNRWSVFTLAEYLREEANINFYDAESYAIVVGLSYRNLRR